TVKQLTPSFAIKNGVLYWGASADAVTAAATAPDVVASADVTKSAGFTAAAQRLGAGAQPVGFSYANLTATAPGAYMTLSHGIAALHDLVTSHGGGNVPEIKLPPLDQITPHLSPAMAARWSDDAG